MALSQINQVEKKKKKSKLETFADVMGIAGGAANLAKNISGIDFGKKKPKDFSEGIWT